MQNLRKSGILTIHWTFFSRFSQKLNLAVGPNIVPKTFMNLGNKIEDKPPKNIKIFNTVSINPKDEQPDFHRIIQVLDANPAEKIPIALRSKLTDLLDIYRNQIRDKAMNSLEKLAEFNLKLKERKGKITFKIEHGKQIQRIIEEFLEIYGLCEYFEYPRKARILQVMGDFIVIVRNHMETDVFVETYNRISEKFSASSGNEFFKEFRGNFAKRSTLDEFEETGVFPMKFQATFLENLKKEAKKEKNPMFFQESIDEFLDKIRIFLFKTHEPEFYDDLILAQRPGFSQKKLCQNIENFTEFHDFAEFLYLLEQSSLPQDTKNAILSETNRFLMKSLDKLLAYSTIKAVLYFTTVVSLKNSEISKNRLLSFQISRFLLSKADNLSQFIAIFADFLNISFLYSDEILECFRKSTLQGKYSLSSPIEVLRFAKLTQKFYRFSRENELIFSLLSSLDDVLRTKSGILSTAERFQLLCFLESIDIPSKTLINSSVLSEIKLCPSNLLPKIVIHVCEYSYNSVDFESLENLVFGHFSGLRKNEKLNVLRSFAFHLQGSYGFWNHGIGQLGLEREADLKETPLHQLCVFYQIVFTIKNYYAFDLPALDRGFIKSWYASFQAKYDDYDQPFYPHSPAFSKEEYELEQILRNLRVAFQKQKKVLIHTVDFFIEKSNLCLELHGRHHFAAKNLATGKTLWKERNIREKSGFRYFAIPVERWKRVRQEEKIKMIKEILKL